MKRKIKKLARFTPMSKLIGIVIALSMVAIVCFSMVMIALTKDLSPLTTLLSGIFGLAACYVTFYLMMAKAEHIEDKKNAIKKELEGIRSDGIITEEELVRLNEMQDELTNLDEDLTSMKEEEINVPTFL